MSHPPGKGKRLSGQFPPTTTLSYTGRPRRFADREVPLEPFKLKLHRRNRHGIRPGVKVGECLVLRDPASVEIVGQRLLASFVKNIQCDVFAELTEAGDAVAGKIVDRVRPVFERRVVSYSRLEGNSLITGFARQLAAGYVDPSLPVLHHLSRSFERTHLGEPRDILVVPFHPKAES